MDITARLLSTIIILFSLACNAGNSTDTLKNTEEEAIIFKKFPAEQTLTSESVIKVAHLKPDGLMIYKDTALFIRNAANSSAHHFSVLQPVSKTFLADQLEFGRKPGQSLSFLSYGTLGNQLWVHDISKKQLLFLNLDSTLRGNKVLTTDYDFTNFYYSVQVKNDNTVISSGDYNSPYKIASINIAKSSIEKQMVPYGATAADTISRTKKMAYESFLFLQPSGEKCVLAARYSDRIEVVDLRSQKSLVVKGPEAYEPKMMIMMGNDGKELSTRGSETRYAFVRGKTTGKYIYLLYSGNTDETEHLYYGKYIYVYDWNGNPVKKLTLPDYVLDFAVTSNDSLLYTYDPVSKFINVSKL